MDNEINNIKNDISEIKNLILQMAKKWVQQQILLL
jgi:hypothetical protein